MTKDEWKNYKEFDMLSREMTGGFSVADFLSATAMNVNGASFLQPKDLKQTKSSAQSAAGYVAEGTINPLGGAPRAE